METQKKILVSLTTYQTDWRKMIDEINKFGITEIAFFPTWVEQDERYKIYRELEKSCVKSIPVVHLRQDFDRKEYDYLVEKYGSKVFNIHPMPEFDDFLKENSDILNTIYVENGYKLKPLFFEMLEKCAGLCIDLSHYEDFGKRQKLEGYDSLESLIKAGTKIGLTHLPCVRENIYPNEEVPPRMVYESHTMRELSDLDYLKSWTNLFAPYNAIELTNSVEEQLEAKKYIENNILGAI